MRLKGRDRVDTLCHGEVAERLNAAVSKTVTSVIPASGVRIPPSPPRWVLHLRCSRVGRFAKFLSEARGFDEVTRALRGASGPADDDGASREHPQRGAPAVDKGPRAGTEAG